MGRVVATGLAVGLAAGLGLSACTLPNPAFDERASLGAASESTGDGDGDPGDDDPGDGDPGDGDPGDGDGDGDPGDGDGGPGDGDGDPELCEAPESYADCDVTNATLTNLPFNAIGLGCAGDPDHTIEIVASAFNPPDSASWRIAKRFGLAAGPNHNGGLWAARDNNPDSPPNTSAAILILSTGVLPTPNPEGSVLMTPGTQFQANGNANPDEGTLPPPLSAAFGSNGGQGGSPFSNCDGINDCSDSLYSQWSDVSNNPLFDKLWLSFTVVPPPGVRGYMFDFAFFSSEYPDFNNTIYNDTFVAWSNSEAFTGNLTFVGDAPLNSTSLDAIGGFAHTYGDVELAGTGFEDHGSSTWLIARGPAVPGESLQITLFLSDVGDPSFATVVLLDNFRWDCDGCEGDGCGFSL